MMKGIWRLSCFRKRFIYKLMIGWIIAVVISYIWLKEEAMDVDQGENTIFKPYTVHTTPYSPQGIKPNINDSDASLKHFPDKINPRNMTSRVMSNGVFYQTDQRRSMDYCNPPEGINVGQEGNTPGSYKLESVHVIIRHGDRFPMYKLPNQDSPRLSCLLGNFLPFKYSNIVTSFIRRMNKLGNRIEHSQVFGLYPRQQTCMGAQLTGLGALQHLLIGDELRKVYSSKLGFLSHFSKPDDFAIKTTDYSRTYQSVIAFLHGLLPALPIEKLKVKIINNHQFCDEVGSGVSCSCSVMKRLRELSKKEEIIMKSSTTSTLMNSIKGELGTIFGLNIHQVPWIGRIVEVLMGYVCHQLPLPCSPSSTEQSLQTERRCITSELIGKMWQYLDRRGEILLSGHAGYKYSLLLVYPLLREIAQGMLNVTSKQVRTKFYLYSGHDLTVSPIAKALGIHNGRWPSYASRIVFECHSNGNMQHFMRVLYDGRDRTKDLIFCEESDLHDGLCPLRNFIDFAFHAVFRTFGKKTYRDICDGN